MECSRGFPAVITRWRESNPTGYNRSALDSAVAEVISGRYGLLTKHIRDASELTQRILYALALCNRALAPPALALLCNCSLENVHRVVAEWCARDVIRRLKPTETLGVPSITFDHELKRVVARHALEDVLPDAKSLRRDMSNIAIRNCATDLPQYSHLVGAALSICQGDAMLLPRRIRVLLEDIIALTTDSLSHEPNISATAIRGAPANVQLVYLSMLLHCKLGDPNEIVRAALDIDLTNLRNLTSLEKRAIALPLTHLVQHCRSSDNELIERVLHFFRTLDRESSVNDFAVHLFSTCLATAASRQYDRQVMLPLGRHNVYENELLALQVEFPNDMGILESIAVTTMSKIKVLRKSIDGEDEARSEVRSLIEVYETREISPYLGRLICGCIYYFVCGKSEWRYDASEVRRYLELLRELWKKYPDDQKILDLYAETIERRFVYFRHNMEFVWTLLDELGDAAPENAAWLKAFDEVGKRSKLLGHPRLID